MSSKNNKQALLGILSICLPPILFGLILWPDIKTIFSSESEQIYIYYKWGEDFYKIPIEEYKEFQTDAPDAKMSITVDGRHYLIPLDRINEFMEYYPNAKLSVLDENNDLIPGLSIHKVPGY
jgi:hypothetical protein